MINFNFSIFACRSDKAGIIFMYILNQFSFIFSNFSKYYSTQTELRMSHNLKVSHCKLLFSVSNYIVTFQKASKQYHPKYFSLKFQVQLRKELRNVEYLITSNCSCHLVAVDTDQSSFPFHLSVSLKSQYKSHHLFFKPIQFL